MFRSIGYFLERKSVKTDMRERVLRDFAKQREEVSVLADVLAHESERQSFVVCEAHVSKASDRVCYFERDRIDYGCSQCFGFDERLSAAATGV